MQGEDNLTSEFDENHKVMIGPDTTTKRVSSNNILTRSLSKRNAADDEVDFEGATNPSVHKANANELATSSDGLDVTQS